MHPLQPHSPHDDEPQAPWHSPWAMDDAAPPPRAYRRPTLAPAPPLAPATATATPPAPTRPASAAPTTPPAPVPRPAPVQASAAPNPAQRPAPTPQREIPRIIPRQVPQAPPRRWNRLIVGSFLAFMGLFLTWAYLRDEDRPQDSDLRPAPPVVSAAPPVAFEKWLTALQAATSPAPTEALLKPAWDWDTPTLSRTVEANRAAWSALEAALLESDWQPQNPAWRSPELGGHNNWDALGSASSALVAYVARKGDERAAMQAALDIAALGRRLQTISSWPTYYNHGLRLQQRASESLAELLRTTEIDGRRLNQMQAAFEHTQPSDSQLRDALNGYYQFERVLFTGLRRDDPWDNLPGGIPVQTQQRSRWFFKPYATLELFAKGFRGLKDECIKPPYAWTDHLVHVVGPMGRPLDSSGTPNYAGCLYANQRLWPYSQLLENHALQRTRHLLVLTLFAIRSYGADNGRAPLSLLSLTPRYFTSLPTDPFSGETVGYDSARGLLFSVGLDYKSDNGHLQPVPMSDPYEPTVSIR